MKKRIFPVVFAVLFLFECSGPAHKLMPEYKKADYKTSMLGVILVKRNLEVGSEDAPGDLMGARDQRQLFYSQFGSEFPAAMKDCAKFAGIEFANGGEEGLVNKDDNADPTIQGAASVSLPPGKAHFKAEYGFLLIIDYMNVRRIQNTGNPMLGSEGTFSGLTTGSDQIVALANFVLWDNKKGTIAAYGYIDEKMPVVNNATGESVKELIKNMACSVTRGLPFGK